MAVAGVGLCLGAAMILALVVIRFDDLADLFAPSGGPGR